MKLDSTSRDTVCIELLNINNLILNIMTKPTMGRDYITNNLHDLGVMIKDDVDRQKLINQFIDIIQITDMTIQGMDERPDEFMYDLLKEHIGFVSDILADQNCFVKE